MMNTKFSVRRKEKRERKMGLWKNIQEASNCIRNILFLKLHAMYTDVCYVSYTFYIV